MRRGGWIRLASCVLLLASGCTATSRKGSASNATTPQEKARHDQLSQMSHDDADAAEGSKAPKRGPRDRHSQQRVIDQPTPRSRR